MGVGETCTGGVAAGVAKAEGAAGSSANAAALTISNAAVMSRQRFTPT